MSSHRDGRETIQQHDADCGKPKSWVGLLSQIRQQPSQLDHRGSRGKWMGKTALCLVWTQPNNIKSVTSVFYDISQQLNIKLHSTSPKRKKKEKKKNWRMWQLTSLPFPLHCSCGTEHIQNQLAISFMLAVYSVFTSLCLILYQHKPLRMGSEHRDPTEICGSETDFMEHLRFSEPKQTY